MLDIPKKSEKVMRSYNLQVKTVETLEKLAEIYGTSLSAVVDQLVKQYGQPIVDAESNESSVEV